MRAAVLHDRCNPLACRLLTRAGSGLDVVVNPIDPHPGKKHSHQRVDEPSTKHNVLEAISKSWDTTEVVNGPCPLKLQDQLQGCSRECVGWCIRHETAKLQHLGRGCPGARRWMLRGHGRTAWVVKISCVELNKGAMNFDNLNA